MLKRIVSAAALAGLISGLLLTAIQQIEIVPLIEAAEAREAANVASQAHQHSEANQSWTPHAGWERALATAVSNIILAIAFALLLSSAMSLRRSSGWRAGLVWGIAGYVVFFVAPALGLPPELPGTDAAPLSDRQLWWVGTVALSGAGLWVAVFADKPWLRILGLALLIAPHLVGAPQPATPAASAPLDLTSDFIRATYITNAILWLSLGGLFGHFWRGREEDH